MKLLKLVCLILVLIVNVAVVKPALADPPKPIQTEDYVTLTGALNELIQARDTNTPPEGLTLDEVGQEISILEYQKYLMETSKDTLCRNNTTHPLAVYGVPAKGATTTFDRTLYLLPAGEETDDDWVCSGVYVPKDMTVTGLDRTGTVAIKILPGTQLEITEDAATGAIALNIPPASVFNAGDVNWDIPDLTQADLASQYPPAPLD